MKAVFIGAVLVLAPTAHAQQVVMVSSASSEIATQEASTQIQPSLTCHVLCEDITVVPPPQYSVFDLSMADRIGVKLTDDWTLFGVSRKPLGVTQSRLLKKAGNSMDYGPQEKPLVRGKTLGLEFVYNGWDPWFPGFRFERTSHNLAFAGAETIRDDAVIVEMRLKF